MSEEELREKILQLENEKENNINELEIIKTKYEELENTLNLKDDEIKNLKLKNYELFTQIPKFDSATTNTDSKEDVKILSINELTNILKKGE